MRITGNHNPTLLTAASMRETDAHAIASGIPGTTLMENAGAAATKHITKRYAPRPTAILCGPGNNGGDGFVIARLLAEKNWPVTVYATDTSTGDAAHARKQWTGIILPLAQADFSNTRLIIDALFGTGLIRNLDEPYSSIIDRANAAQIPIIAIDIPSGIHSDSGEMLGAGIHAESTVTFCRAKPGHVLLPGKSYTGLLHIADIGIDNAHVTPSPYQLNTPSLWQHAYPALDESSHKYTRGHTLIIGGNIESTGAARLSATAALRIGSGLVSVACSSAALPIYASSLTAVVTRRVDTVHQLDLLLDDPRITAIVAGPGMGLHDNALAMLNAVLQRKLPTVLDADALTLIARNQSLQPLLHEHCVLTPHEGEFKRLFSYTGDKLSRTLQAARDTNAIVLLKGSDTIIATPKGSAAINYNAPVYLATAGSGDVLAGMIGGLLAQGMPRFEAASAAAWLHAEAAHRAGKNMIAEDLALNIPITVIPALCRDLRHPHCHK